MEDLAVVTGGAGFIGSHLVERLVESGQPVRVVEKPGAPVGASSPGGRGRPRRYPRAFIPGAAPCEGARWVYHLAANPNLWAPDPAEFDRVNSSRDRPRHRCRAGGGRGADPAHQHREHPHEAPQRGGRSTRTSRSARRTRSARTASRSSWPSGTPSRWPDRAIRSWWPIRRCPSGPGDRGLSPPTRLILDFCRGKLPVAMDCTLNLIDVRDAAIGIDLVMERGHDRSPIPPGRLQPHAHGPPGASQPPDGRARSPLAGALSGRAGRRRRERVLGRPRDGPHAHGDRDGPPPRPTPHAFRSLAQPGRARASTPRNLDESLRDAVDWLRTAGSWPLSRD